MSYRKALYSPWHGIGNRPTGRILPSTTPVLNLLDEFAAHGHLPPIGRAIGLLAGYGVQLWPIPGGGSSTQATYGKGWNSPVQSRGASSVSMTTKPRVWFPLSALLGQATVVCNP
ncbi:MULTISPECIES: TraM recognition domain-containing protein [unclassified Mesorhizobium]|nr:TraM recognition domain-containing protein [Mesorhizobium sp. CO1-1-4]MBZ9805034.1 TraM recognition domain-containing protein [Mesorhizobium sp. ES1-6]